MQLNIQKATASKEKPDSANLKFGVHFTDHMFVMDYAEGKGWYDARIIPYQPLQIDPSTMVFHYGQSIFEGLKAFRRLDNQIFLFRPKKHFQRLNISAERVCIPQIDVDFAMSALNTLIEIDRDWLPTTTGNSLYIRPFVIATDPYLGVRPSQTYRFIIIMCPVGAYYKEGINPVKIFVENDFVRAVKGGMGNIKTSGNYAASLKAQVEAEQKDFTQVLWLDGIERKYVEEVGTMNIFFKIGDEIVTPSVEGSILAGITRDSIIQLLGSWGVTVNERKISIEEVYDAHKRGTLEEVFGSGTAAVVSPVGELSWKGERIVINDRKIGQLSTKIYETITGIQTGKVEDKFNWMVKVD